jgi:WD40 repeat protein
MVVVDLETGQKIRSIPVPSRALSVDFSRDGKLLVAGGEWGGPRSGEAAVWNLATGAELGRFKQSDGRISSVAFLPDGRAVVIAAPNRQPALYQVQDGKCLLQRIEPSSQRQSWSDDGTVFLGHNVLFESRTGKVLQRFELPAGAIPECLSLSPGRRWAAFSHRPPQRRAASITVHDVGSGRMLQQIQPQSGPYDMTATVSLAFTPDGRRLVAGVNAHVRVFEVASGREVVSWEHRLGTVADVSPDGRFVLATGPGQTVRLYGLPR